MGCWYLRYYCVGWHYVFYFFGPGIYKTKPLTLQGDERAIFRFELIAICLDLLFTPQHCKKQQPKLHIKGIVHPKITFLTFTHKTSHFNPIWLFISDRTKNNDHIFAYNESKWGSRLSSSDQKAVNITCVILINSFIVWKSGQYSQHFFFYFIQRRKKLGITQVWVNNDVFHLKLRKGIKCHIYLYINVIQYKSVRITLRHWPHVSAIESCSNVL